VGVAEDNEAAIKLCEGAGFVATGETEPFQGRDGIVVRNFALDLAG
jgi:hypothetical protein